MENIIIPYLQSKIKTIEFGNKQQPPDFWNRDKQYDWELKLFTKHPSFDISNFISYINQLNNENGVEKKLYRTTYIIFKYSMNTNYILIEDFKMCNIWELILYNGKYPISLQNKKNMWYNIRPCSFNNILETKTQCIFIKQICKAIKECPNNIKNIEIQYNKLQITDCIDLLGTLSI
jgi:hypothetical protein